MLFGVMRSTVESLSKGPDQGQNFLQTLDEVATYKGTFEKVLFLVRPPLQELTAFPEHADNYIHNMMALRRRIFQEGLRDVQEAMLETIRKRISLMRTAKELVGKYIPLALLVMSIIKPEADKT